MYIYIDRTLLPERVQNYSGYATLGGGGNAPIEETMYSMLKEGWAPKPSDREIIRFFDEIKGGTILLFSSEGKMIGWAKLAENPKSSADNKLVELQIKTEYTDNRLSAEDFSIQRYINGSPDPSFLNKDDKHMATEPRIKEVDGNIINDCLIFHIGPYLKLDESIWYEVISDTVNIIEVRTEKLQ